ncbi:MAG: hypothetical protein ABIO44_01440 [Saprospiraceae bacterium]
MNSITGDHYTLGLYHGEDSGNFMLYMNNDIFLIDYNILEDKVYQFYIGNEFMKLSIVKKESSFIYTLDVDTESPTPLNLAMQRNERSDQNFLLFGLIIISILLLLLFIYNYFVRYTH